MQVLVRTSMLLFLLTILCIQFMAIYIIGNTAFCNMLEMRHVKFTAICWFYTNTILYTRAVNLTVIYACR